MLACLSESYKYYLPKVHVVTYLEDMLVPFIKTEKRLQDTIKITALYASNFL